MAFPTDMPVTHPGQSAKAGNVRDIFLEKFSGEVFTQFEKKVMALGMTRVKTLSAGKSYQFPIIGDNTASYHTPGQLIEASKIENVKLTVTVDDFATSSVFIDELDDAMTHYDARQYYVKKCSYALAKLMDKNIFRMIARVGMAGDKAAVEALGGITLADDNFIGAHNLANAGDELDGSKLVDALFKIKTKFEKIDIDTDMLVAVFPPDQYEALVNASGSVGNMAWMNQDVGGTGSAAEGTILKIAGIPIRKSNNLPNQNESAGLIGDPEPIANVSVGSGRNTAYRADYSKVVGLIFTKECVATVKVRDLAMVHEPQRDRLGDLYFAKLAVGHNILRHQCACTLLAA